MNWRNIIKEELNEEPAAKPMFDRQSVALQSQGQGLGQFYPPLGLHRDSNYHMIYEVHLIYHHYHSPSMIGKFVSTDLQPLA